MLKKRCSIKRKTEKPPCKHCKKNKVPCTFYAIPAREMSKKEGKKKVGSNSVNKNKEQTGPASQHHRTNDLTLNTMITDSSIFTTEDLEDSARDFDSEIFAREATPDIELEDIDGRRGKLRKLRTCFAHPIQFHTRIGLPPPTDCSFCEFPAYSFTGMFEKQAYVIAWPDGAGYTEIAGGHRETCAEPTTLCQRCTVSRLQIIVCHAHQLAPLDIDNVAKIFDSATDELLGAEPRSAEFHEQMLRWCSMCFSLATYACCAPQPSLFSQEEPGEDDGGDRNMVEGCGLRLCGRCEKEFREVHRGDLNSMATSYELKPKAKENDEDAERIARADVGLLMNEGLLMRTVELE